MNERVSVIRGRKPIVFVASHTPEESLTGVIARKAAEAANGYAVINNGFQRASTVDVLNNRANCNRIDHVIQDVVRDEFLDPINKIVDKWSMKFSGGNSKFAWVDDIDDRINIFYIHGCGDAVNNLAGDKVGCIIGYGDGTFYPSYTCPHWEASVFARMFNCLTNTKTYRGTADGMFSANDSNNLTQYFRVKEPNVLVSSMQLEFPLWTRDVLHMAEFTGQKLGEVAADLNQMDECLSTIWEVPTI